MKKLYTVPEVAAVLNVSRSKTYALVHDRQLAATPLDGVLRVPGQAVLDFLDKATEQS